MTRVPSHRAPTHPGEILLREFLEPLEMSQLKLAHRINVSYPRVNELVHGKRTLTPDTALRLSTLFGTSPEFWLNLQQACDLYAALNSPEVKQVMRQIKPVTPARVMKAARRVARNSTGSKAAARVPR